MHQAHNIPWQTLCRHLRASSSSNQISNFRAQQRIRTSSEILFVEARCLPDQAKQVRYFADAFSRTISLFSKTERSKHPAREALARQIADGDETLFTQECLDAFESQYGSQSTDTPVWWRNGHLNYQNGTLREWHISRFSSFAADPGPWPNVLQLSALVIVLFEFGQAESLLKLAQLPGIPWQSFCSTGQSHHIGYKTVLEVALVCYIWLNVIYSFPDQKLLKNHTYASSWTHHAIYGEHVSPYKDHCPQCIPHVRFWGACGDSHDTSKILQDKSLEDVHHYLSWCFEVIYLCDLFVTELGGEIDWRDEIMKCSIPLLE